MNAVQISKGLLAGLTALAAVGFGGAAQADTVFTFSNDLSGSEVVNMVGANGSQFGVYAGRYRAQLGPAQGQGPLINIFCVDYTHDIHIGDYYTANTQQMITGPAAAQATNGYYNGGLASAVTATDFNPINLGTVSAAQRASEVAYLADNYLNATTFNNSGQVTFTGATDPTNNLAAVSLSIWDIMQDGGDGLGGGGVQLAGSTTNYSVLNALSGYYEQQAAAHSNYQSQTAEWIQAPIGPNGGHAQDYVTEVPEPAGFLPMLLGVGGLAALAVARRRKASV